jgi:hypothetical protein
MDLKILVKVGQLQHQRFQQGAFQGFKGFTAYLILIVGSG